MTTETNIIIRKTEHSRVHPFVKDEIKFGTEMSDHMLICDYKDGKWGDPEIVPYENFSISPATSFIHYGQAIFEGVKAYRQNDGSVAVFRPEDNWKRLNVSAVRMDMPELPRDIFMEGLKQLIALDEKWVPNEDGTSLYIRPFMFATDEFIGVRTSETYRFAIITSPAGAYYNKPVNIYVQDQFVRAVKGGIGFTKAAGNYGASMYPSNEVKKKGYDQILWTDAVEHKYVQEIGTMNVFFIVDGVALTPDLKSGTILAGVTRDSIIKLLKANDIKVEERPITIDELVQAHQEGKLEEAFGSGTAASMSFIASLTYQDKKLELPKVEDWKVAPKIKELLDDIRYGRKDDEHGWTFKVN
ncbi:MAG TPA: branched-chain amino acid aminotransferase [Chitinophagaceae bacterium]|nr:branched-chain amino acid aminotransferase [Chitinophagaceae bacterium]